MWPDDRDLPIEVDAAFGAAVAADPGTWSWTSLSSRLRAEPIRLRAGMSGGAAQVSPGTCTVTLVNDDAALTPLHPMSPYWPNVELGTPLRVRLRRVEDAFARTSVGNSWGTADSGEAWSVGGTGASVSGGVARHSHTDVGNVRSTTQPVSLADSEQVADIAPSALLTGAALVTGFVARFAGGAFYWLRAEFNSGGTSVALKISRYTPVGGHVDLAVLSPVPGLTYAANSYLRVRASVAGTRLAIKAWPVAGTEPSGWQLTATDSAITGAGKVGFQSWLVAGNSNALPVAALHRNYTAHVDRFAGHADQWEPTYVPTGVVGQMSSAVRVTASGVLRRLQQGAQVPMSPLRRTIAASGPLAFYPIEDGVLATQAGAALPGQLPVTTTGAVEFNPVDDYNLSTGTIVRYGTSALADLAGGGRLDVTVPAAVTAATQTVWTVHVAARVNVATASANTVLMEWTTPGSTYPRWQLQMVKATLRTQVIAYNVSNVPTVVIDLGSATPGFDTFAVSAIQVGGNIRVDYTRAGSSTVSTNTIAGTLRGVAATAISPTSVTNTTPMPFGHLAIWATDYVPYRMQATVGGVWEARRSFLNEPAHDRLIRLTSEDGLDLDTPTPSTVGVQTMGWQSPDTAEALYQESAQADGGIIYERGFRLAYLPRVARYNQPADLTIDLATYAVTAGDGETLKPVYDDRDIRNEWTAERAEGSFVVAVDALSQRRGVYADSVELNLASDAQLPDRATWLTHLTSEPDLREATFPLDLAANPSLLDGWLSCQVGARIVRTNPPAQHRPGPLNRTVLGWTETIGPRSWVVLVNPSPASPWQVATVDGVQRVAADGSTLAMDLTDSGTVMALSHTAANGAWTWDPSDYPLDVRVGGENVRADAPGFVINDNPWLLTDASGWSAGIWDDTVTRPGTPYGSLRFVSTGGVGGTLATTQRPATAGTAYIGTIWAYAPGAGVALAPAVNWHDSGGAPLSSSFIPAVTIPAGVWTPITGVFTSPASTAFAVMRARQDGATPVGAVWYCTALTLATEATTTGAGAFQRLSCAPGGRGLNGVQRAWPTGTPVDVWQPAIPAL
ncbi:hypothetical protein JNW90_08860 [Micromonospora sp. STR1s_5]|nr:hypothetical protein [Micromonospora sp. STR1s_5]